MSQQNTPVNEPQKKKNPLLIAFFCILAFILLFTIFSNVNLGPSPANIPLDRFIRYVIGNPAESVGTQTIRVSGLSGTSVDNRATISEIVTEALEAKPHANFSVMMQQDGHALITVNVRGALDLSDIQVALDEIRDEVRNEFSLANDDFVFGTFVGASTEYGPSPIHSVLFRGSTIFVLLHELDGETVTSNRINNFAASPGRNAHFRVTDVRPSFRDDILAERTAYFARKGITEQDIRIVSRVPSSSPLTGIISWILPVILIILVFMFLSRGVMGRNGLGGMSKHRAQVTRSSPVRFNDVAGIEEEKAEVEEIVQFLRTPHKFLDLGARIPKGFLLVGQPGTGKTLLAKAIAGEAGVPFFSISGSDFSEMLVGVGPSRMRDLFEEAKLNAPCIIFIDEIDSIARMRGVSIGGAAEEGEQTLNQLLVQMDGFTKSEGVIVLAATNRPDVLDPALLRPGRFDRQIVVQIPDVSGREKILGVHTKNKPISSDVDLKRIAQIISGFSGADIENLMNEAAIIAAKKNRRTIGMQDIQEGINKVILGPQKRSRIITDDDKKITAYHEAGHAVVSRILQPKYTVQEVSIIPRGMAAGYTLTNDQDDVTSHKSKSFLKNQLALYMGGRAAEAVFCGDICTGAQQDLKVSTNLAEKMVTHFGMSEKLGPLYFGRHDEAVMRQYDKNVSDQMQSVIDSEIKALLVEAMDRAKKVMADYKKEINVMVEVLLERETIYAEDIDLIMSGKSAKAVCKGIEERLEKVREQEKKERMEQELAMYEREVGRLREIAASYLHANLRTEDDIRKIEENIVLGRKVIEDGGILTHLPTLDNIHVYGKLINVEVIESGTDKVVLDKKPRAKKVVEAETGELKETEEKDDTTEETIS